MKRTAFTLTELLVVIATVILLMSLVLAGVSSARSSQQKNQTRATISKINEILMAQWRTYPSQSVVAPSGWNNDQYKRWNRITGDIPPNWVDVAEIAGDTTFKTRAQNTYRRFLAQNTPNPQYADAECLFLSVMYGGFAGCLDCAGLRSGKDFKDTDGDNCPEFIDAWGKPLGFVLWPVGLRAPGSSSNFFDTNSSGDQLTFGLRPLIFSAGPDGSYGIDVGGGVESDSSTQSFSNLSFVRQSNFPPPNTSLGSASNPSTAADNITNFDAEFRR